MPVRSSCSSAAPAALTADAAAAAPASAAAAVLVDVGAAAAERLLVEEAPIGEASGGGGVGVGRDAAAEEEEDDDMGLLQRAPRHAPGCLPVLVVGAVWLCVSGGAIDGVAGLVAATMYLCRRSKIIRRSRERKNPRTEQRNNNGPRVSTCCGLVGPSSHSKEPCQACQPH